MSNANGQAPGSAEVAANLSDAAESMPLAERDVRSGAALQNEVHAEGGTTHHVEATALGFDTTGWVGLAALVVVILLLVKKVPAAIAGMLDGRIAAIRTQLDEAKRLRAEAESLRAEYEAKAAAATADAATMRAHAQSEAQAIVAKAKVDAETLMDRRAKMAEDKIAAAERAAIAEVRARAADAAAKAAGLLIAERLGAENDARLIDRTIAGLGRPN